MRGAARAVGVLGILFIGMFGLDAFAPGVQLGQALAGFIMHSIPAFALAIMLGVAWRYEFAGGVLFVIVSLLPFALLHNLFWVNILLAAPFALAAILFLIASRMPRSATI